MKIEYSPTGNGLSKPIQSFLWNTYYYCPAENKMYQLKLEEITPEMVSEVVNSPQRYDEMLKLAKIIDARNNVTEQQLKQLGLI